MENGAAALKPCVIHFNVLMLDSLLADNGTFVEIDCVDYSKFRTASAPELHAMVDALLATHRRVVAGEMPKIRLDELQIVCGFNCEPKGMLVDVHLRRHIDFLKAIKYDWRRMCLQ